MGIGAAITIWNPKTGKRAAKSRRSHRRQKVDRELTASKHFLDKRSFCNLQGGIYLAGQDMAVMHDAVLFRDGWACVHCGAVRDLQVHHLKHKGHGGSDDMSNLETTCDPCHVRIHGRVPQWSAKEVVSASDTENFGFVTRPNLNAEGK